MFLSKKRKEIASESILDVLLAVAQLDLSLFRAHVEILDNYEQ